MTKAFTTAVCILALMLPVPALFPQSRDQRPVIRAKVEVVNVLCTVRDKGGKGNYVSGLIKDDFEVFENGARQTVDYFNHGMGEEADPLTIALLIDTSGSVKNKLSLEQEAAVEFLRTTLRKNKDIAAVVQFHEEVKLEQDFTFDLELLERAVRRTRAGGGTKLYDAIWVAAEELLKDEAGRRVAVVLSDGDDTLSELSRKDAIQAAQEQDIVIFGVGVRSPGANFGALKTFARETGGLFVDADVNLREMREAFLKINGDIKNQYSLGYVSTNPAGGPGFREIRIRVKKPGLNVKHRKGYYAAEVGS
jgi:VWFA-related protein